MHGLACSSGSLLLKTVKVLGLEGVRVGFYGQRINIITYNLCRINMFCTISTATSSTSPARIALTNLQHWDNESFELIMSNLPYSIK